MPNFQVPQFIEEKPKIIGPLTLVQFLYLAGAGLLSFIFFNIFSMFVWFLLTVILAVFAVSFSFLKINGQEMHKITTAIFRYLWQPKTFTWQKAMEKNEIDLKNIEQLEKMRKRFSLQEKLKSVALKITTSKFFSLEKNMGEERKKEKYQVVTYATGEKRLAKKIDYKEENKVNNV